jgi:hypothetical protein
MPAAAEGGVDVVAVGPEMKGVDRFVQQDGAMCV